MTPAEAARIKAYIDAMVTVPADGDHFAYPAAPQQPAGPGGLCPDHVMPWVLKPAGFSQRTQKPYGPFWACQVAFCNQRPPRTPQGGTVAPQAPVVAPESTGELP